jgi:hypothetical protein
MTNDELLASLLMESATEATKREATAFDELAGPFQKSGMLRHLRGKIEILK